MDTYSLLFFSYIYCKLTDKPPFSMMDTEFMLRESSVFDAKAEENGQGDIGKSSL